MSNPSEKKSANRIRRVMAHGGYRLQHASTDLRVVGTDLYPDKELHLVVKVRLGAAE